MEILHEFDTTSKKCIRIFSTFSTKLLGSLQKPTVVSSWLHGYFFRIAKCGKEIKRTPVVIGELMWKPFDVRFKDHVERMHKHRQLILDELYLWNTKASVSEREFAAVAREKALKEQERTERASAKERQLTQDEHRLLAEECRLLAEERCRMVEERAQKVEESQRIASFLAEIRKEKAVIEQSYLGV